MLFKYNDLAYTFRSTLKPPKNMRHTRAAAANGADFTKLNNRKLNLPAICLTEEEFLVPKFAVRSKFGSRLTA